MKNDMKQTMKQVKLSEQTDKLLTEIADKRKSEMAFIRTKQDIVAQAVAELHKREMKR